MKFKEIIDRIEWSNVKFYLINHYFKDVEEYNLSLQGYIDVLNELKDMKTEDSKGMRLYVELIKDEEGEFIRVIGRDGKLQKESSDYKYFKDNVTEEFANSEATYALEMEHWEKWLDMDIPIDVISKFSLPEITAHCLFEMTQMGYNQSEIRDKIEKLSERLKSSYDNIKEEDDNDDDD